MTEDPLAQLREQLVDAGDRCAHERAAEARCRDRVDPHPRRRRVRRGRRGATAAAFILAVTVASAGAATQWFDRPDEAHRLARSSLPVDTTMHSGAALRQRATELAPSVPLPTGGNFNGVQWETIGNATDQQIARIQQYNAACQWLRAAADGREPDVTTAVLGAASEWPALRTLDESFNIKQALTTGRDRVTPQNALTECRASHEREIAYARSRGLAPPS